MASPPAGMCTDEPQDSGCGCDAGCRTQPWLAFRAPPCPLEVNLRMRHQQPGQGAGAAAGLEPYIEQHKGVGHNAIGHQGVALRGAPGEAVQQPAPLLGVSLCQPVLHDLGRTRAHARTHSCPRLGGAAHVRRSTAPVTSARDTAAAVGGKWWEQRLQQDPAHRGALHLEAMGSRAWLVGRAP